MLLPQSFGRLHGWSSAAAPATALCSSLYCSLYCTLSLRLPLLLPLLLLAGLAEAANCAIGARIN